VYRIRICRSINARGSIIISETLATLYAREVPDDINETVVNMGGDLYEVEKVGVDTNDED
jgi:hypothetical protein